jgi:hypothetical protein
MTASAMPPSGRAGRARVLAEFSEAHVIAQTLAVYAETGG